jgi:GNAT superfamily N-acetyltransferase
MAAGDRVSRADAEQLARLHRAAMPYSVLGALGTATLRRYYRWVARSADERVFVSRDGDRVIGVAVLSFRPANVIRRFVMARPLSFATAALARFVQDSAFRRQVRAFLAESSSNDAGEAPELLQIFVAAEARGRHNGTALLRRVEEWLSMHGHTRYYVRTLADNNASTLAFYDRRGFAAAGERLFCGSRFAVLVKKVG